MSTSRCSHEVRRIVLTAMLSLACSWAIAVQAADFALQDGDTVVFLGDSLTAARTYGKIIENYSLLRFPDRKLKFFNAGFGGDTAAGGAKRLERDVFSLGATVVTVAFGTNDIGWGALADDAHKQQYLNGIRSIVTQCRARGVRVYVCSAAVTGADPTKSEDSFLQQMCDEGLQLSRDLGGQAIDVQRSMREIQKRIWAHNERLAADKQKDRDKDKVAMFAADGVHLNDLGQLIMAYAILKGLEAPADVSSLTIDGQTLQVEAASGCAGSDVTRDGMAIEFSRLDHGLPFNYGLFYALHYVWVPVPQELSRYILTVKNLPVGKYRITADGRGLGNFNAQSLAQGVNLTFATENGWVPGGPWNAQANVLRELTDSRHDLAASQLIARTFLKDESLLTKLKVTEVKADAELINMQREVARPRSYRFRIEPIPE